MRLYHGASKAIDGDRFSIEIAMEQDGNAAYGVGLYFARSAHVAEMYAGRKGHIYHVEFTPNRLVNDLTQLERKLIAESVFEGLPESARVALAADWADDGESIRQARQIIVDAVMREESAEEWLSALQFSLSPQEPQVVNQQLATMHGIDGLVADMGDEEECVVVINDQALSIVHVELAQEHRAKRREQRKGIGVGDPEPGPG